MGRKVKCKICKRELDSDEAFCIEKVSPKNGRISRSYFCDKSEYDKDKEEKETWRLLLVEVDIVLGYTCISKTKVNMIMDILDSGYSRKQLYNCLKNNSVEIKRYLDEKDIRDEYGKLSYIFACVKNKIKDSSDSYNLSSSLLNVGADENDFVYETDEDIFRRLDEQNKKNSCSILDILDKIERGNKDGK